MLKPVDALVVEFQPRQGEAPNYNEPWSLYPIAVAAVDGGVAQIVRRLFGRIGNARQAGAEEPAWSPLEPRELPYSRKRERILTASASYVRR